MKEIKVLKETLKNAFDQTLKTETEIDYKGVGDIVTNNDILVEKYIIESLKENFPNDLFLTEEHFFENELTDKRTWVIDPIDGTANYAYELDLYVVQVALLINKEIALSYIYMPTNNSHYYAIKGKGAYLNDKRLKNDKDVKKSKFISMIGVTHNKDDYELFQYFMDLSLLKNFKIRMLGSVGYEMAKIADNTFDILVTTVSNIWDIAPGILLAREAGFKVLNMSLEDYQFGDRVLLVLKHDKDAKLVEKYFYQIDMLYGKNFK